MIVPSPAIHRSFALSHIVAGVLAAFVSLPAAAQLPGPTPVPTSPATSPTLSFPPPIPALTPVAPPAGVVVPQSAATPTPTPTPSPIASPTPRTAPAVPMTRVRQIPTAPLTRLATPTPTPTATLAPPPTPLADPLPPLAEPNAEATGVALDAPPATPGGGVPWWFYAIGLLALGVLVFIAGNALRKRRPRVTVDRRIAPPPPVPAVPDAVPPAPAAASPAETVAAETPPDAARAHLEVTVKPRRAGVNLVTATADIDVLVRNTGARGARGVQVIATLTSAATGQEQALADLFAAAPGTSAVPAFALAAGEGRSVRILATMPRQDIVEMRAGNRPMFVPVVAVDVRYTDDGGTAHQHAHAVALGVERTDSPKLAPIWLDAPARMYDTVAARAHGVVVDR